MYKYQFTVHVIPSHRFTAAALICLSTLWVVAVRAQEPPKYSLDAGGQHVQLEAISFGSGATPQPESGAAVLRRHFQSDSPSLSDLAHSRSQPKLYLRFRDAESNGMVQYTFDDVRFGQYRQIGTGPDAVETLAITYSAFAVKAPELAKAHAVSRGVAHTAARTYRAPSQHRPHAPRTSGRYSTAKAPVHRVP